MDAPEKATTFYPFYVKSEQRRQSVAKARGN